MVDSSCTYQTENNKNRIYIYIFCLWKNTRKYTHNKSTVKLLWTENKPVYCHGMSSTKCFNIFQGASKTLKNCENIVRVSNRLGPGETPSYSASHPDPSRLHIELWSRSAGYGLKYTYIMFFNGQVLAKCSLQVLQRTPSRATCTCITIMLHAAITFLYI